MGSNMSAILAKQFFDYPGLRDIATFSTAASNTDALKFLDNYMQSRGLTQLERRAAPNQSIIQTTYQAQRPFDLSKIKGNQGVVISSPDTTSSSFDGLSQDRYDKLHQLKAGDISGNLFGRFAGQLTGDPAQIDKALIKSFANSMSYLGSDEAAGLLAKMRERLKDVAKNTGAKLLFVDSIPGGSLGKYLPTGRGTGQPTILVANTSPEKSLLGKQFFTGKIADFYPPERKALIADWEQTKVGFHELAHHLSNVHSHNEAALPDIKLFNQDFTFFQSPSHTARELHAEPVAAYIAQGNNPILPEQMPEPLRQLAFDAASKWLYNYLPNYSGPTPILRSTATRMDIPTKAEAPEEIRPKIWKSAAEVHADYLTRSDFSNQVLDSVNYYQPRR